MPTKYCCDMMKYHCSNDCDYEHDERGCPDEIMRRYSGKKRGVRFGIPIHDGGDSAIRIAFCPWCGVRVGPDVE